MKVKLFVFLIVCSVPASAMAQDARAFWKDVLQKCATSDIVKKNLLYVGPTNNMGVGSVWRKAAGNWRPQVEFNNTVAPDTVRATLVNSGTITKCSGTSAKTSSINPTLVLQSVLAPIGLDIGLDLKKARTVTVSVDGYTWDTLLEGTFVSAMPSLSQTYREAVRQNYVVGRVLRVSGISAELGFDNATQASLQTKYSGGITATAGLKGAWTNKGTLKVTAPDTAFVVVEMWKYQEVGFQSGTQQKHFKVQAIAAAEKVQQ